MNQCWGHKPFLIPQLTHNSINPFILLYMLPCGWLALSFSFISLSPSTFLGESPHIWLDLNIFPLSLSAWCPTIYSCLSSFAIDFFYWQAKLPHSAQKILSLSLWHPWRCIRQCPWSASLKLHKTVMVLTMSESAWDKLLLIIYELVHSNFTHKSLYFSVCPISRHQILHLKFLSVLFIHVYNI